MSTPADFGFDHEVKFSAAQMISHMHELNIHVDKPWTKPKLLPLIERHHAEQRELLGINNKEHLLEGFDPRKREFTKAKLRQVLSQYGIEYPSGQNADRSTLIRIFRSNLNRLRSLDAAAPTPSTANTRRSQSAVHQLGRTYRVPSAAYRPRPTPAVQDPVRAPSSQRTWSNSSSSPRRSAAVLPEHLVAHIERLCVDAVRATQRGDFWGAVDVLERAVDMCSKTAIVEDERAESEARDDLAFATDEEDNDHDYEDTREPEDLLAL